MSYFELRIELVYRLKYRQYIIKSTSPYYLFEKVYYCYLFVHAFVRNIYVVDLFRTLLILVKSHQKSSFAVVHLPLGVPASMFQ